MARDDFEQLARDVKAALLHLSGAREEVERLVSDLQLGNENVAECELDLERAKLALFEAYPDLAPAPSVQGTLDLGGTEVPGATTFAPVEVDDGDAPPPVRFTEH